MIFYNPILAPLPPAPPDQRISIIQSYKEDAVTALVVSVALVFFGLLLVAASCPVSGFLFAASGIIGSIISRDMNKIFSNLLEDHQHANVYRDLSVIDKLDLIFRNIWLSKKFFSETTKSVLSQLI